mmetsp:Transcript_6782/g.16683  ORF Transcript_6782/g.16683 Transcript_6782/m.16683 type:complete len:177 (+) Transcript_6782:107-637(+)
MRKGVTLEQLASLDPILPSGKITPGAASQITDGATGCLVVNEAGLKKLGATPRGRIHTVALAGDDPAIMLRGPIPATHNLLQRSGLSLSDMDVLEVNEAFACVPMAWLSAFADQGASHDKLNVQGGAIALGHPTGATGTRLVTTTLCQLERCGGRYGLIVMAEGGGLANAAIIERL